MKYLLPLITVIASCSKQPEINQNIKIGFVQDTLFEYQKLRHYYSYSNLKKLNQNDLILEAKVVSNFGEINLLDYFDRDSISFGTFVFTSCADFGIEKANVFVDWAELDFKFILKTKSGIDTAFTKKEKFYFNCSPQSPVAEGLLKDNVRIGKWIFYKSTDKSNIHAITHYDKNGLRDGVDTIYHDFEENRIDKIVAYKNGLKNGKSESFSETTGQIISLGQYENGLEQGKWFNITYRGFVNLVTIYDKGQKVSEKSYFDEKIIFNDSVKNAL